MILSRPSAHLHLRQQAFRAISPLKSIKRQIASSSPRFSRQQQGSPKKSPVQIQSSAYFLGGVVVALALYELYQAKDSKSAFSTWPWSVDTKVEEPRELGIEITSMSDTLPPIAPGRPETLTKAEEAKLKEFWTVVLRVFGVENVDDTEAIIDRVAEGLAAATIQENVDGKKDKKDGKKSRMGGLLRGSKKDKDASAASSALGTPVAGTPASASTLNLADEKDDKHGQTKAYRTALSTSTPSELRQFFWDMVKCDNPDALLLRFLRARKWDTEKALIMMVSTVQWRAKEMKVCFCLMLYFWCFVLYPYQFLA